jgi:hypothetical protein
MRDSGEAWPKARQQEFVQKWCESSWKRLVFTSFTLGALAVRRPRHAAPGRARPPAAGGVGGRSRCARAASQ